MDNKKFELQGRAVVVSFKSKSGAEMRAFGYDLGYTVKLLAFDQNVVAELLGVAVRDLFLVTPHGDGERAIYEVIVK